MRILILFIVCFIILGCGIYEDNVLIVTNKEKNGDNCNYTVSAPNISLNGNFKLRNYPCDCFDVGDTLDITLIGRRNNGVD